MRKYKKYCLLLLLLLWIVPARADNRIQDSLVEYNKLDTMFSYAIDDDPVQALNICMRQTAIANELGMDSLIFEVRLEKGACLSHFGLYDKGMDEYYEALHAAERLHSAPKEAKAFSSIGMVYMNQGDFKNSRIYLQMAKDKYIAIGSGEDTIRINFNLGYLYTVSSEADKGIALIKENLAVARRQKDEPNINIGLNNLAHIYFDRHENEQALACMLESLKDTAGEDNNYYNTSEYEHLAELYVAMKQWDNAKKYLAESFKYARIINSKDWLYDCYKLQSRIDEGTGDYKGALEAHKLYLRYKDTVFNVNYANKTAALASIYELEKKQGRISLLEKDNELKVVKIKHGLWQRNVIIICSVLLLGLVTMTFVGWLQRKTKNMQILFSRSLLQNQEVERQRISRELHDSVGQNILFIKNQLSGQNDNPAMAVVMETITATIAEVRDISKDLYPNQLEKYGLSAAVDALAEKVNHATGIFVSADLLEAEGLLSKEMKINFFRIIQECLNNAIKHAGAKAVRITATTANNKIALVIMDNGKGFDTGILEGKAQGSFGMINMEERAKMLNGKMAIESSNNNGTKISITIPITNEV